MCISIYLNLSIRVLFIYLGNTLIASTSTDIKKLSEGCAHFSFDVAAYIYSRSDEDNCEFLNNMWVPEEKIKFSPGERNLKF